MTDTVDFYRRTPNGIVWVAGKSRRAILDYIWRNPGATSTSIIEDMPDVVAKAQNPLTTVNTCLHALHTMGLLVRHRDTTYVGKGVRYAYHLAENVAYKPYKAPKPKTQVIGPPQLRITSEGDLVTEIVDEPELPLEMPAELMSLPSAVIEQVTTLLRDMIAELERLRGEVLDREDEIEDLHTKLGEYADLDEERSDMALELAKLKQWKANAIAKHPDLDVSPLLLKARKIVVELGQTEYSPDEVLLGFQDDDYSVQHTLAILRAAQQED